MPALWSSFGATGLDDHLRSLYPTIADYEIRLASVSKL